MTVSELIEQLKTFGEKYSFGAEVWIASHFHTEPAEQLAPCVDMDTNITHAEISANRNERFKK